MENEGRILPIDNAARVEEVLNVNESTAIPGTTQSQAINEDQTEQGKKRKITSESWLYFNVIEWDNGIPILAKCKFCDIEIKCRPNKHGTSSMTSHWKFFCRQNPAGKFGAKQGQQTLSFRQNEDGKSDLLASTWSVENCRKALVDFVVLDGHPYNVVEGAGFKRLFEIAVPRFKVPSRNTVARDSLKLYLEEKAKMKKQLKGRRICLTTDTWTSVQNISYMCLTGHWIDSDWVLQKRILSFCQVSNHRGETIGKVIEKCLIDWGIDGFFTMTLDNASNNNVAIDYLKRNTKLWKNVVLSHEFLHVRCAAHILNLIVNDGIKVCFPSMQKIRNAVRYVRSSPYRLERFKSCVRDAKMDDKALVSLDCPTRWNSTYLMLETALKFERPFERMLDDSSYISYFKGPAPIMGPPDFDAWEDARKFIQHFKVFNDATNTLSGNLYVTSNHFFHELINVQCTLLTLKNSGLFDLRSMGTAMKEKFDKYWDVNIINVVLFVALVLDPRYKMLYITWCFEKKLNYEKEKVEALASKVKSALDRLYDWHVSQSSSSSSSQANVEQSQGGRSVERIEDEFEDFLEQESDFASKSEVDRYLAETRESTKQINFDVLSWWKSNNARYPILSLVAIDVLAVPITSVASESAFSTGGRTLDNFRSSLTPTTVEALICTQDWIRPSRTAPISLEATMQEIHKLEEIDRDVLGGLASHPSLVED